MKKIIEGIARIAVGMIVIELVKRAVVWPGTDAFDEGLEELKNKSKK